MDIRNTSYRAKTGIIGALSGGTIATTAGVERLTGIEPSDFINTPAKLGVAWAGYRVARIALDKLGEWSYQENEAIIQEIREDLPTLKYPVSPSRIMSEVGRNRDLINSFGMTRRAYYKTVEDGSELAEACLRLDVNHAVVNLASEQSAPVSERDSSGIFIAGLRAVEMSIVLDKVAPIAPDCPKTPQTSHEGKFWFDFIESRARDINLGHTVLETY